MSQLSRRDILKGATLAGVALALGRVPRGSVPVAPLAAGGPVLGAAPYIVGESGPEYIVTKMSGWVYVSEEALADQWQPWSITGRWPRSAA